MGEPRVPGQYAGIISRALAFLVDAVAISASLAAATWLIGIVTSFLNLDFLPRAADGVIFGTAIVGTTTWFLVYHVFFTAIVGQTPGKAFMGLRVITIDGHQPTLWRAALRVWAYSLSAALLGLGFVWIMINGQRQGWHDKLAGTAVIYDGGPFSGERSQR